MVLHTLFFSTYIVCGVISSSMHGISYCIWAFWPYFSTLFELFKALTGFMVLGADGTSDGRSTLFFVASKSLALEASEGFGDVGSGLEDPEIAHLNIFRDVTLDGETNWLR